jgi:hypothetical protein
MTLVIWFAWWKLPNRMNASKNQMPPSMYIHIIPSITERSVRRSVGRSSSFLSICVCIYIHAMHNKTCIQVVKFEDLCTVKSPRGGEKVGKSYCEDHLTRVSGAQFVSSDPRAPTPPPNTRSPNPFPEKPVPVHLIVKSAHNGLLS